MAKRKTHNPTDRLRHLDRVADYRGQGYSISEIAALTQRSRGQICKDLKACDAFYKKAIADKREVFHRNALVGHEHILKEAWRSFRASKQRVTETTTTDPNTGEEVVSVSVEDDVLPGDPRFLQTGLQAWKGLRDLMGLDEPTKTENSTTVTVVREDAELSDADLKEIISGHYTEQAHGLRLGSGTLVPFSTLGANGTDPVRRVDDAELRNGTAPSDDRAASGEG